MSMILFFFGVILNPNVKELESFIQKNSAVVLISENLDGHRGAWLSLLRSKYLPVGRGIAVLTLANGQILESNPNDSALIMISTFESKSQVVDFVQFLPHEIHVLAWDGDTWLLSLIRNRKSIKILLMRPYLSGFGIKPIFIWFCKLFLVKFETFFCNCEFAILAVPGDFRRSFMGKKVNDPNFEIASRMVIKVGSVSRLKRDSFRILLPGFISDRKNPKLAVEACRILVQKPELNIQLRLSGVISANLENNLKNEDGTWLIMENRYLDEKSYVKNYLDSDLILLPYENIGSSGSVIEALALGVPVLMAYSRPWSQAEKLSGGRLVLTKLDAKSIAKSIETLVRSSCNTPFDFRSLKGPLDAFDFLLKSQMPLKA